MTNKIFWGYTAERELLEQSVFAVPAGSKGDCLSLCGPHGIGKTYLIDRLITEFEQRNARQPLRREYCFYIETRGSDNQTLIDFQCDLISLFAGKISLRRLNALLEQFRSDPDTDPFDLEDMEDALDALRAAYALPDQQPNRGADGYENWCAKVSRCMQPAGLNSIFANYTLLGIRVILVMDEFDRAAASYPTGDIFHWLFSVSNKSSTGSHLNLSTVLLSRRRVGKIAHHMADGSSFESAYPPHPLRGFGNHDLEDYFSSYEQLPCGIPNEMQRRRILYRCGRHPALLMNMRTEAAKIAGPDWSVEQVWRANPGRFQSVYEKMCAQLQSEKISRMANTTMMDAIMYQFEFFAVEDESYHERLIDAGFATAMLDKDAVRNPADGTLCYPDIFVLAGTKAITDSTQPIPCEPLSPYFLDYIRMIWKPNRQNSIADYLELTERALRSFMAEGLQKRYGDGWKAAAEAALPPNFKQNYLEKLQDIAALNGYTGDLSILDVLGFDNYMEIIQANWTGLFEPCFAGYTADGLSPLESLVESMDFLRSCRNTNAHGSIKVLNARHLSLLQSHCDRLNAVIQSGPPQTVTSTEESAAPAPALQTPSAAAAAAFMQQVAVVQFRVDGEERYLADLTIGAEPFNGVLIKPNNGKMDAYIPQNIWPYKEQVAWRSVRKYVLEQFALWQAQSESC